VESDLWPILDAKDSLRLAPAAATHACADGGAYPAINRSRDVGRHFGQRIILGQRVVFPHTYFLQSFERENKCNQATRKSELTPERRSLLPVSLVSQLLYSLSWLDFFLYLFLQQVKRRKKSLRVLPLQRLSGTMEKEICAR